MGDAHLGADLFGYSPPVRPDPFGNREVTVPFCDRGESDRRPDVRGTSAPDVDSDRAGLSKALNGTTSEGFGIRAHVGGSLVEILAPRGDPRPIDEEKLSRGIRGKVQEFSAGSARRFRHELAKVRRSEFDSACLLTLTYPRAFPAPDLHEVYKGHLKRFNQEAVRYCEREGLTLSGHWRLEFQLRGAAHFHLLLYGIHGLIDHKRLTNYRLKRKDRLRCYGAHEKALAAIWYRIVSSGDTRHLRAGVRMEALESIGGGISYMAKYAAKKDQTRPGDFTGRYWGKVNSAAIPYAVEKSVDLPGSVATKLQRILRRKLRSNVNLQSQRRQLGKARQRLGNARLSQGDLESLWRLKAPFVTDVYEWIEADGGGDRPAGVSPGVTPEDVLQRWRLDGRFFEGDKPIRPRRRYRVRNNQRVSLLCDASSVVAALIRGMPDPDVEPF